MPTSGVVLKGPAPAASGASSSSGPGGGGGIPPGEASYWAVRDLVRRWQDSQGKGGGGAPELGGETKKKADALYYFRKASEWGDDAAAKKWLQEYFDAGGSMKSIRDHIRLSSPLSGLALGERQRFSASLRPEDKALVAEAKEWNERGRKAMTKKLGERTFTIPTPARRQPSVYSN